MALKGYGDGVCGGRGKEGGVSHQMPNRLSHYRGPSVGWGHHPQLSGGDCS
jgi:hypothetical protein